MLNSVALMKLPRPTTALVQCIPKNSRNHPQISGNYFKPRFIYIKIHNVTGKMYFGYSTRLTIDDVVNYEGSGKYWVRHLKFHGNDATTMILKYFDESSKEECTKFCLSFSERHNIVKAKQWANLMAENGISGGDSISCMEPARLKEVRTSISNGMRNWFNNMSGDKKEQMRQNISEGLKKWFRNATEEQLRERSQKVSDGMKRWYKHASPDQIARRKQISSEAIRHDPV